MDFLQAASKMITDDKIRLPYWFDDQYWFKDSDGILKTNNMGGCDSIQVEDFLDTRWEIF